MPPTIPKYRCILGTMITWVLIPIYHYLTVGTRTQLKDITAFIGFSLILSSFAFWQHCDRSTISSYIDHSLAFLIVFLLNYQFYDVRLLIFMSIPYLLSYYLNKKNFFCASMCLWLIFRAIVFWHFLLVLAPHEITKQNLVLYNTLYALHGIILLYVLPKKVSKTKFFTIDFTISSILSTMFVISVLKLQSLSKQWVA